MSEDIFTDALQAQAAAVEGFLSGVLNPSAVGSEIQRPPELLEAIRHGVLNGGKRFRPFLVMESTKLFGQAEAGALNVAAALECVHCYSLIHDDLPAMDNDDMRRGQPTVHVKFGEANAILAGDSLLTFAFDLVSDAGNGLPGETRAELVSRLARAAGMGGMAGGQALDLAAANGDLTEDDVITLQSMKTGALIRFACEAGAIIAGAGEVDRHRLRDFGETIGLAFQLADDLLDLTESAEAVGKATGKDEKAGKKTLVGLKGVAWAREELERLVTKAEEILEPYGEGGAMLSAAARFVAARRS